MAPGTAWRCGEHCYAYLSEVLEQPPAYGTPEWWKLEEEKMLQAELREAQERRQAQEDEELLFGAPLWPD